ncbi:hypothetical protein RCC89_20600 [Cytophagaceae bacterium ABcell3]|nr:hypothetical protein RCC89_20600 [Cytophagaceae bacterium ABcell3]
MKPKKCLECQQFFQGRSDKKFCSDYCRNAWHNRQNGGANHLMRTVNSVLRKNRRILAECNPDGKARMSKERLMAMGFNFNYFTNIYRTNSGKAYYFCYDQGYLELEDETVTLVVRQEYVK